MFKCSNSHHLETLNTKHEKSVNYRHCTILTKTNGFRLVRESDKQQLTVFGVGDENIKH